jgi:hypothetical protein
MSNLLCEIVKSETVNLTERKKSDVTDTDIIWSKGVRVQPTTETNLCSYNRWNLELCGKTSSSQINNVF